MSEKILIPAEFDLDAHKTLREEFIDALKKNPDAIELHFINCTYINSVSLGLLLILREMAAEQNVEVKLVIKNATSCVCDVLKIVNFDKLFPVIA